MNSRDILPVVIKDLFKQQFKWTVPFIGIILIVNVLKIGRAFIRGTSVDDFYSSFLIAGNIYMFVIGIISIFFLSYLVEHGITRSVYFKGAFIVAICLSVIIPLITWVIYKIQRLVATNFVTFKESQINNVATEIDGTKSIFDDIITAAVTSPYIDLEQQTFLALAIFTLNLLFYYLAGWLIGAAFQYPVIIGLSVTFLTALTIALQDSFVRTFLDIPVFRRFEFIANSPKLVALIAVFGIIVIIAIAIRQLTKKTVVNI